VFSTPIGRTVVLLADVTDARCEQVDKIIRLTWKNPPNSTGAMVKRANGSAVTTLSNSANGSYEDANTTFGTAYSYTICANYSGLPSAPGIGFVITPVSRIDSFHIVAEQVNGNVYKVSWDIRENGIDLKIMIDADKNPVREVKSDIRDCDITLPLNEVHTITALAYSNGKWIRSLNSVSADTSPLEANILWKVSKPMFKNSANLEIKMSANQPVSTIPELVLCACPDGQFLKTPDDPRARVIQTFKKNKIPTAQKYYENTIELSVTASIFKGMKLFLFESAPSANASFTFRWAQGFAGKI
jgi:hypothetical protein